MQVEKPKAINKKEIIQFLSLGKNAGIEIPQKLDKQIEEMYNKALQMILPKYCCSAVLPITKTQSGIQIDNTNITLEGNDIALHLENCHSIIVFCATLGQGIDKQLLSLQLTDMASYFLLDACANSCIEQVADIAQQQIIDNFKKQNEYFTMRYSPGYGDLPLSLQPEIIKLLNTEKQIGVTCTKTYLLMPKKSITAIIGVSKVAVTGRLSTCNTCNIKDKCEYRKRGEVCNVQTIE